MPYDGDRIEGNEAVREHLSRGFGVPKNFTEEELARAVACQVVHSSFADPGADWNRWDLIDEDGTVFASRELPGY
tara:strand:- start:45 stop:269 length:225 start_codon:yes stop_codon:yes gene_type:complete